MLYAVKQGRQTGIFDNWEECKAQVHKYSGAEYKKFKEMKDAVAYLEGVSDDQLEGYYIDGSYCKGSKYGYSVVVVGKEITRIRALTGVNARISFLMKGTLLAWRSLIRIIN